MTEEEMVEAYVAEGWDREEAEAYAGVWHYQPGPEDPFPIIL